MDLMSAYQVVYQVIREYPGEISLVGGLLAIALRYFSWSPRALAAFTRALGKRGGVFAVLFGAPALFLDLLTSPAQILCGIRRRQPRRVGIPDAVRELLREQAIVSARLRERLEELEQARVVDAAELIEMKARIADAKQANSLGDLHRSVVAIMKNITKIEAQQEALRKVLLVPIIEKGDGTRGWSVLSVDEKKSAS